MSDISNLVLLFADWPFFIFHLSVIVFVVVQICKKNPDYKGGFFVLYLTLAINDSINFIQILKMKIENAWFRPAVCYLVEVRGMSMKEVADMFGVYHQVVSHAITRYNETGKHEDRKGCGRKRTSRDETNIEEARNQLRQNNQTKRRNGIAGNSTRKLGRKLGISCESARRSD